jgi:hypothetical protein
VTLNGKAEIFPERSLMDDALMDASIYANYDVSRMKLYGVEEAIPLSHACISGEIFSIIPSHDSRISISSVNTDCRSLHHNQ